MEAVGSYDGPCSPLLISGDFPKLPDSFWVLDLTTFSGTGNHHSYQDPSIRDTRSSCWSEYCMAIEEDIPHESDLSPFGLYTRAEHEG